MHSSVCTLFSTLLLFFTLLRPVTAHGYIQGIEVANKWYPGYTPWWRVNPQVPHVKSAGWSSLNQDTGFIAPSEYGSTDIACHKSGKTSKTRIPVNAGDKVKLMWTEWPESHKGPVLTYLARCPGDCSIITPDRLSWVKIDQKGMINGAPAPGTWATDTLIANNNTWTVKIPSSLAAGSYVMRHEIIALHSADKPNGAQNYPQCINFKISGKGTANPAGVKATSLYTEKAKGISISIYWPTLTSYSIPGPALWKGATKRWVERVWTA